LAVYAVAPNSGIVKQACESSPRVALVTDAKLAEMLPAEVRSAADFILTSDVGPLRNLTPPAGADGVIAWFEGEQLIRGGAADLRGALSWKPGRCLMVPVHLPCLPEADLISVQPRVFTARSERLIYTSELRIASTRALSGLARAAFKGNKQPWARLSMALLQEQQEPGCGVVALSSIWQPGKLDPVLAALVLRNLILLLIRENSMPKAEELLGLGIQAFPGLAEFEYLTAVYWVRCGKQSKAIKHLELATQKSSRGFVGSGGENSCRALWLLGSICEIIGDQGKAINCYGPGVNEFPAFRPSVESLLTHRFSRERAAVLAQPICEMLRREPQYLEIGLDFLLQHDLLATARCTLETVAIESERREVLLKRLEFAEARLQPWPRNEARVPGVTLKGPFLVHSGHARINRELGSALMQSSEVDASLEPFGYGSVPAKGLPNGDSLHRGLQRHPRHLDLTIRHQRPPTFRRPAAGKLACILPWEYNAVPRKWVEEIEANVDELWVPSNFVRSAFIDGGVNPERVHMIPNGVDAATFCPQGPAWRPAGCGRFALLFVGGTIRRKGMDLLLQAYGDAFSPDDDVTLIVKDVGSAASYQHNNLLPQVVDFSRRPNCPHLLLLTDNIDDTSLAALYRGCDALVLPYRGEGFGMPLAEAMACGKPVVATARGPSEDLCSAETAYLIPAQEVEVPEPPPPLGELSGEFTWFEPDIGALARTLRHAYQCRDEAARRGKAASKAIQEGYTWPHVTQIYLDRIRQLVAPE
jgi:glycosyltransferase involved in cell wall biosynthesis